MHKLNFPYERYTNEAGKWLFVGDDKVGIFELLWAALKNSPEGQFKPTGEILGKKLDKKDRRIIKSLFKKFKDISIYKDQDKDSRIINNESSREVWLENQEYDMLVRLLDANTFAVTISETLSDLWDIIDNAKEEELKPQLVKDATPTSSDIKSS